MPLAVVGYDDEAARPAPKQCNCKRSNCLKLYCECFAAGIYCRSDCNCVSCFNNISYENLRMEAVEAILDRNAMAFRPKILPGAKAGSGTAAMVAARHNRGCQCKKSFCLKKYCECFQAGIVCSTRCKCKECKNFNGSLDRERVLKTEQRSRSPNPVVAPAGRLDAAKLQPSAAPESLSLNPYGSNAEAQAQARMAADLGAPAESYMRDEAELTAAAATATKRPLEDAMGERPGKRGRSLTHRHAISRILCNKTINEVTYLLRQADDEESKRLGSSLMAVDDAETKEEPAVEGDGEDDEGPAVEGDGEDLAGLMCEENEEDTSFDDLDGGAAAARVDGDGASANADGVSKEVSERQTAKLEKVSAVMASQERVVLQYFSVVLRRIMLLAAESVGKYEDMQRTAAAAEANLNDAGASPNPSLNPDPSPYPDPNAAAPAALQPPAPDEAAMAGLPPQPGPLLAMSPSAAGFALGKGMGAAPLRPTPPTSGAYGGAYAGGPSQFQAAAMARVKSMVKKLTLNPNPKPQP